MTEALSKTEKGTKRVEEAEKRAGKYFEKLGEEADEERSKKKPRVDDGDSGEQRNPKTSAAPSSSNSSKQSAMDW